MRFLALADLRVIADERSVVYCSKEGADSTCGGPNAQCTTDNKVRARPLPFGISPECLYSALAILADRKVIAAAFCLLEACDVGRDIRSDTANGFTGALVS